MEKPGVLGMAGEGSVTPDLHTQNSPSKKLINRREKKQQTSKKREGKCRGGERVAGSRGNSHESKGRPPYPERRRQYQTPEPSNQPWVTQREALT